ncbi:hypothetical protein EW146_g3446 [Bondarzewia mesenterica]|uniref:Uncharacterized protein n=1 Tax=Bondarzewia mesenterica TaxID=1095465 RepID=A0A4S4LZB1_9AGAM|nr:hypothetical protein EW146_g3446 [Bondarzewia mesenterica]
MRASQASMLSHSGSVEDLLANLREFRRSSFNKAPSLSEHTSSIYEDEDEVLRVGIDALASASRSASGTNKGKISVDTSLSSRITSPLSSPSPSTPLVSRHYSNSSDSTSSTTLSTTFIRSDDRTSADPLFVDVSYVGKTSTHVPYSASSRSLREIPRGSAPLRRGVSGSARRTQYSSQESGYSAPASPSLVTNAHVPPSISRRQSHLRFPYQPLAIAVNSDESSVSHPSEQRSNSASSIAPSYYRSILAQREDFVNDCGYLEDTASDFSWEAVSSISGHPPSRAQSTNRLQAPGFPRNASPLRDDQSYAELGDADEDAVYALQMLGPNVSRDHHDTPEPETPMSTNSFIDLYGSFPSPTLPRSPPDTPRRPASVSTRMSSATKSSIMDDGQLLSDFLPDFLELGPDQDRDSLYGGQIRHTPDFQLLVSVAKDAPDFVRSRGLSVSGMESSSYDYDNDRADPILAPTPIPGLRARKVTSSPQLARYGARESSLRPLFSPSRSLGAPVTSLPGISYVDAHEFPERSASMKPIEPSRPVYYAQVRRPSPLEVLQKGVAQMQLREESLMSAPPGTSFDGAHEYQWERREDARTGRPGLRSHGSLGNSPSRAKVTDFSFSYGQAAPSARENISSSLHDLVSAFPITQGFPAPLHDIRSSQANDGLLVRRAFTHVRREPPRPVLSRTIVHASSQPSTPIMNEGLAASPGAGAFEPFDNGAFECPRKAPQPTSAPLQIQAFDTSRPETARELRHKKSYPMFSPTKPIPRFSEQQDRGRDAKRPLTFQSATFPRTKSRPPSPTLVYNFALNPGMDFNVSKKSQVAPLARTSSTQDSVSSLSSESPVPSALASAASESDHKSFFSDVPEKKLLKTKLFGKKKKK